MKLQVYVTLNAEAWPEGLAELIRVAVEALEVGPVEKVAVTQRNTKSLRQHPSYVTETWDPALGCRRN